MIKITNYNVTTPEFDKELIQKFSGDADVKKWQERLNSETWKEQGIKGITFLIPDENQGIGENIPKTQKAIIGRNTVLRQKNALIAKSLINIFDIQENEKASIVVDDIQGMLRSLLVQEIQHPSTESHFNARKTSLITALYDNKEENSYHLTNYNYQNILKRLKAKSQTATDNNDILTLEDHLMSFCDLEYQNQSPSQNYSTKPTDSVIEQSKKSSNYIPNNLRGILIDYLFERNFLLNFSFGFSNKNMNQGPIKKFIAYLKTNPIDALQKVLKGNNEAERKKIFANILSGIENNTEKHIIVAYLLEYFNPSEDTDQDGDSTVVTP